MPDTPSNSHPFTTLTPTRVLDALEQVGLRGDGRLTALNSYENRVYLVHLEDPQEGLASVVAKFYRPGRWDDTGILEEHAFAQELADDEIPVVAPLRLNGGTLHHHEGFSFSVSPRRGGRPPELEDHEALEWIGRFLGRLHLVGARHPFRHRPALNLNSHGHEPRDWLLGHHILPSEVRTAWQQRCEEAITFIATHHPCMLGRNELDGKIRLHGDCHAGNILWTPSESAGAGPHLVDLDDARNGPAVQDLWMLLSGDRPQRTAQLAMLLDGYEQVRPFDRRELALIEPLRTLRLIHYSAWLARRWDDPIFPINFPWFGTPDYWRGQIRYLEEQLEAMQAPPLTA